MDQAEVWSLWREGTCASADNGVAEPVMKTKERGKEGEGMRKWNERERQSWRRSNRWWLAESDICTTNMYLDSDHL